MDLLGFTPIINTLGFIILATAIWWSQWRSGAKQVSAEVIANYTALDKQQKEQIADYKRDIEEIKAAMRQQEKNFIERIAKMEGQNLEKDKRIHELEQLVTNRNPELERVLTEIRDFMHQLSVKNDKQTELLEATVATNGNSHH